MKLTMDPHSLGTRLVLAFALTFLLGGLTLLALYYQQQKSRITTAYEETARNLLIAAEGVRRSVAGKWDEGVFSVQMLREFAREPDEKKRKAKIVATVPVAAAWSAMKHAAAENGFRFKAPRARPRNKDNTPDPVEARVLERFARDASLKELSVVDEGSATLRYFRPVRLGDTCLICHGDPADSLRLWGNSEGKDILGYPMEGKKEGDLHGAFELMLPLAASRQQLRERVLEAGFALLGFTGLLLLAGLALTRRILVEPLTALGSTLEQIAAGEGDLNRRLEVPPGRGEIAWLAGSFNRFVEKLQQTVREVSGVADRIAEDAGELRAIGEHNREVAAAQNAEVEQAATAMNQMSASAREVAASAGHTSEAVAEAEREIGRGGAMVEELVAAIDRLSGEVRRAGDTIQRLHGDTDNIGGVLDVIREIADQTNLLALNAAIEAARAGEQGRGFAVVADEVRTLAGRTQASITEIQEMIERLQHSSREAVEVMQGGSGQAREAVERARDTGEVFQAIRDRMRAVTEMVTQIASAAEEQSAVSEEINQNLSHIRRGSGEVEASAVKAQQANEELAGLAGRLRSVLGHLHA